MMLVWTFFQLCIDDFNHFVSEMFTNLAKKHDLRKFLFLFFFFNCLIFCTHPLQALSPTSSHGSLEKIVSKQALPSSIKPSQYWWDQLQQATKNLLKDTNLPLSHPIIGFGPYHLLDSLSQIKKQLQQKNPYFQALKIVPVNQFKSAQIDGIHLLDNNLVVIGQSFLKKAIFFFNNQQALVNIQLFLNPQYFSFSSALAILSKKYGSPSQITNEGAFWSAQNRTLSLTTSLQCQYTDLSTLASEQSTQTPAPNIASHLSNSSTANHLRDKKKTPINSLYDNFIQAF